MKDDRLGRYRVAGELGRGGMSVVYRGHDPVLDRPVAIKVLHPHLASRDDSRTRFTREAKAVARLKHPSIVEVYDYAPPDSERAYIVTELIEGPTLRAFIEEHPLRHSEICALLMVPIFEALAHAHDKGVVHRDVKPENVMLRPDGTPVLMDFGIASMIDTETLTATGTMLGSPAHMAPEVVEGEPLTAQADLFSAGTVMYWMVCGALPFSGPTPAALFRRLLEARYDPVLTRRPHAGRAIARLIEACMARQPADRPASATAVAQALMALLADAGLETLRPQLRALMADPSVYQDALGRQLVPRYVEQARIAFDAGLTGRAIDFLDRVLAIDDEHPEAQDLLRRIERGRRRGANLRLALGGLAALGAAAGLWWGLQALPDQPGPTAPSEGSPARAVAGDARPDPAAPRLADAGRRDAMTDGRPKDAGFGDAGPPDLGPAARPDQGRRVPELTVPWRRRRPPSAPPPTAPATDAVLASAPEALTPVRVPVKGGAYKSTQVHVNGRPRGYIYEIERDEGLLLPPGRHTLRFTNPACQPFETTILVNARSPRGPTVAFECTLRPAIVRITANRDVDVRGPDGRVIGRTNQDFPFTMSKQGTELRLTLGDPGDSLPSVQVKLYAGEQTVKEVNF